MKLRIVKATVFLDCLIPLGQLSYGYYAIT